MIFFIPILILFILIWLSGELVVNSSVNLSYRLKVSPVFIGLFLISACSSLPELAVSILAALEEKTDIILGGVIGSNIANILLIFSLIFIIYPLRIKRPPILDLIYLVLITLMLTYASYSDKKIASWEALSFFILFFFYAILSISKKKNNENPTQDYLHISLYKELFKFLFGISLLMISSHFLIDSLELFCKELGISLIKVSTLILALGTSLPELAISIIAAKKKQFLLILGNIIGSNIFNISLVLALSGLITEIPVPIHYLKSTYYFFLFSTIFFTIICFFLHKIPRFLFILPIYFYLKLVFL